VADHAAADVRGQQVVWQAILIAVLGAAGATVASE
jgi:hypothetical protein